MNRFYDIHSHRWENNDVVRVLSKNIDDSPIDTDLHNAYCSYGIHPYYIDNYERQLSDLRKELNQNNVVAIGECGLDKLVKASMDTQIFVFKSQALMAEEYKFPLIIHCVKAWDELLAVRKELKTESKWIIHGFRGNASLAKQLISHGLYLSFGLFFNIEAPLAAYPEKIFLETDNSEFSIQDVYTKIKSAIGVTEEELAHVIAENVHKTFISIRK